LFESVRIDGEAAASVARISYFFSPDGSYTGAALVLGEPPAFQTLSGRWSLSGETLDLGSGLRVRARVAGESLRLESELCVAQLRRVALQ
jgi:hypothetical protein